jgi:hypothetical protein
MENQDIQFLAALLKKRIDDAEGMAEISNGCDFEEGQLHALKSLARSFARFSSVDKVEFLTACGIDP